MIVYLFLKNVLTKFIHVFCFFSFIYLNCHYLQSLNYDIDMLEESVLNIFPLFGRLMNEFTNMPVPPKPRQGKWKQGFLIPLHMGSYEVR